MSLKAKIEAVIYASEEPVTLQQLVGLLTGEAQAEVDALASAQALLRLEEDSSIADGAGERNVVEAGTHEQHDSELARTDATPESRAVQQGEVVEAPVGVSQSGGEIDAEPFDVEGSPGNRLERGEPSQGAPELSQAENGLRPEAILRQQRDRDRAIREHIRRAVDALITDYRNNDRGIEIREVASGFRMGTKPEYHDAVRGFVKTLKPALKLTLPALETLAVVAYRQPVTAAEISEIRGVDSSGVLGGLMARKLIATAGRKQVIGRPMLYKTTRDFLLRFGLKDVNELPSMEEFERMAGELAEQDDLPMERTPELIEQANARGDAEHMREATSSDTSEPSGLGA